MSQDTGILREEMQIYSIGLLKLASLRIVTPTIQKNRMNKDTCNISCSSLKRKPIDVRSLDKCEGIMAFLNHKVYIFTVLCIINMEFLIQKAKMQ